MSAMPLGHPASWPLPGGHEQVTSVLIFDDRPEFRTELAARLGQTMFDSRPVTIACVADGAALVEAFEAMGPGLVMIGVHAGSEAGLEAITRLQGEHPSAAPVIIGSSADIDLLGAVYARGAGGLLLWESEPA